MELRQYWRVLVRRGAVIRNTVILVALLSIVSVAYSFYGAQWDGRAQLGVQMQPQSLGKSPLIDSESTSNPNTGAVISDLVSYAGSITYFKTISAEARRHGYNLDYRAISQHPLKVFRATDGNSIFLEWYDSNQKRATTLVSVAGQVLADYVPVYKTEFRPSSPRIRTHFVGSPDAFRQGVTSQVAQVLLRIAVGLAAAIVLAFLFEYLDDTVHDDADIERAMGLPTLAVIPGGRPARTRTRSA